MGGVWAGNDVYFAQTQSQYTAAFLPEYPEKSKRDSTISCCWLNGGWNYSGVYAEELSVKNGGAYWGYAPLSNRVDDVETVHAIKTIEDCLWKQYPQYRLFSDTVYQCGGACFCKLLRFAYKYLLRCQVMLHSRAFVCSEIIRAYHPFCAKSSLWFPRSLIIPLSRTRI